MVVVGESAGGNLATVVCLLAKEQGMGALIKAQICVCPCQHLLAFNPLSLSVAYLQETKPESVRRYHLSTTLMI